MDKGDSVNWISAIPRMYADAGSERHPRFHGPAEQALLEAAELELGEELPAELRQILSCTDGIEDVLSHETGDVTTGWLVWPVSQIISENHLLREGRSGESAQEMSDEVLVFASAGADGILFGYGSPDDIGGPRAIVVWNPLQETLVSTGFQLREFLQHWLSGDLKV